MIGAVSIVAIITAIGALVLAVGSLRSHRLKFSQGVQMALAWGAIIIGLVLVFRYFGA